jgi:hypothetical protein
MEPVFSVTTGTNELRGDKNQRAGWKARELNCSVTTGTNEFRGDKNQRAGLKAREPDCFVTTGTNEFRGEKNQILQSQEPFEYMYSTASKSETK